MAVYKIQKKNQNGIAEDVEIAIPAAEKTQLDTATQDISNLQKAPILQLTSEQINTLLTLAEKLTVTPEGHLKSTVEIEAPSFNDIS